VSCWLACQGTDLIIEAPTAMAGVHIAETLNIPYFGSFTMPWTRTKHYPHPFASSHLGGGYNYMSHLLMEQIFWIGISPMVNKFRVRTLNRPPIQLGSLNDHKIPYLYSFSPTVVPHPPDWQDWIHTCGFVKRSMFNRRFWFLDNPENDWTPPESLSAFLANGSKPIYIGFGSIVVNDPEELTEMIVESVVKSGVRAILSKGWSGRSSSGVKVDRVYPDCIYAIDKIPHDWLFPLVAGVVHHGGAGTTAAGLRAGVPSLIKPFFGDQYFWADRIQEVLLLYSLL
jgi:sterol 3beta-glucosyltransferase